MYRVFWASTITGKGGRGEPLESKEVANAWAEKGNKEYPEILHYVEEV